MVAIVLVPNDEDWPRSVASRIVAASQHFIGMSHVFVDHPLIH